MNVSDKKNALFNFSIIKLQRNHGLECILKYAVHQCIYQNVEIYRCYCEKNATAEQIYFNFIIMCPVQAEKCSILVGTNTCLSEGETFYHEELKTSPTFNFDDNNS